MNEIVYRYAAQETFLKMLESQELWFSDIRMMNDWDEYSAGHRIVSRIISDEYPEKIDIARKISPKKMDPRFRILICSFSSDGDCLSMWRGYGDNGEGASIGYSHNDIKNYGLFNRYLSKMAPIAGNVNFFPIIYDANIYEDEVRKYLDRSRTITSKDSKNKSVEFSNVQNGALGVALMRLCTLYKNDFFVDEREIRGFIEITESVDPYEVSTRKSDFGESAYHKFGTTFSDIPAIKEVILGPKSKITKESMQEKLKEIGLAGVVVKQSRGTYR